MALVTLARVVEFHNQVADVFRESVGLHHRHIAGHGRIGSEGLFVGVGQQRVRMAANDDIEPRHRLAKAQILRQARVCQRDDLVDTPASVRVPTSACRLSISSMNTTFGPGEEVSAVSVARAETMPIFSPPTSSTT